MDHGFSFKWTELSWGWISHLNVFQPHQDTPSNYVGIFLNLRQLWDSRQAVLLLKHQASYLCWEALRGRVLSRYSFAVFFQTHTDFWCTLNTIHTQALKIWQLWSYVDLSHEFALKPLPYGSWKYSKSRVTKKGNPIKHSVNMQFQHDSR